MADLRNLTDTDSHSYSLVSLLEPRYLCSYGLWVLLFSTTYLKL